MLGDFAAGGEGGGGEEFDGVFKKKDIPPRRRRPLREDADADASATAADGEPPEPAKKMMGGWGEGSVGEGEDAAPRGRRRGSAGDAYARRAPRARTRPPRPRARARHRARSSCAARYARSPPATCHPARRTQSFKAGGGESSPAIIDDDDDGIPVIPDLDEAVADEAAIDTTVADAPVMRASARVQSINELDNEIQFSLPSATEIGIDLSALTQVLYPQDQVAEPDEEWTFDKLVTTLSRELREEAARADEQEERANGRAAANTAPLVGKDRSAAPVRAR